MKTYVPLKITTFQYVSRPLKDTEQEILLVYENSKKKIRSSKYDILVIFQWLV